ncbi:MFS transporter [bacterium]|nr:MFS transporter [bacterium]
MDVVTPWSLICRNSPFRRLWFAQLISMAGDFISQVALSALLYERTGQAVYVAALAVATNLPLFLASPLAGVAADRCHRIRLMFRCDLIRAGLVLALLAVARPGGLPIWMALLVVAATETVSAFFEPASAAALPGVVSAEELPAAISLSSASWSMMLAVGAALGGLITTRLGTSAAILANSLSFLVSALLIASLPVKGSQAHEMPPLRPWQDLKDGCVHVLQRPRLVALLLIKVAFGLGTGVLAMLTVLPMQVLHSGQSGVATLFSARGLGAVVGPVMAHSLARSSVAGRARWAGWGIVFTGLFYLLVSQAASLRAAACWVLLAHVGSGLQWVLSTTLLQQSVDDAYRGRVMAFDFAGVTLSMSVSTLAFGSAIDHFGVRAAGGTAALLMVLMGILWLMVFTGWRRQVFQEGAT